MNSSQLHIKYMLRHYYGGLLWRTLILWLASIGVLTSNFCVISQPSRQCSICDYIIKTRNNLSWGTETLSWATVWASLALLQALIQTMYFRNSYYAALVMQSRTIGHNFRSVL
eukprot:scaffold155225_cov15-Prasinocladus_malaysianus.AAC.1